MLLNEGLLNESLLNGTGDGGAPPEPVPVSAWHEAAWDLLPPVEVEAWHEAEWTIIEFIVAWHEAVTGARITAYNDAPWGFAIVPAWHAAAWSLKADVAAWHDAPFSLLLRQPVETWHEARWSSPMQTWHEARWSARVAVGRWHEAPYGATNPVGNWHEAGYDLLLRNPVERRHSASWDMRATSRFNITGAPYVLKNGAVIGISGADFSCSEDGYAWTSTMDLAQVADYQDFRRDDPFEIVLFGDSYRFIVESKSITRNGPAQVSMSVSGVSPAAVLDSPRATMISKTWTDPTMASTIALEVCGAVPLEWEVIDWLIPGGRLAVSNASPLSVLLQLAKAVGGLVEATTAGGILVRPEFPVTVPDWEVAVPDHVFGEVEDNITCREGLAAADLFNRFYLSDSTARTSNDRIDFEMDENDAHAGSLTVYPGRWRENLVVTTTRNGVILVPNGVVSREEEETIEVTQGTGQTAFPIDAILAFEWLDRDLGGISAAPYSNGITAAGNGHADQYSLLKIRYRTKALVYRTQFADDGEVQYLVEEV